MFHSNKPVEIGLVAATRHLLARPPEEFIEYDRPLGKRLGPTLFLKQHTSTTEWESFTSMAQRACDLDECIYEHSLHTMLCHAVKNGSFERKCEGRGHATLYRRVAGVETRITNNPRTVRHRVQKSARKVTQQDW